MRVQRAGRAFERRRAGGTSTRINSWPFRLHARDLHAKGTQTCDMRHSELLSVWPSDRRACVHGYMCTLRSGMFNVIEAARN